MPVTFLTLKRLGDDLPLVLRGAYAKGLLRTPYGVGAPSLVVSVAPALATLTTATNDAEVAGVGEQVPPDAHVASGAYCTGGAAAKDVLAVRDRLKMPGSHAGAVTAEMIQLKSIGDGTNKGLVDDSMGNGGTSANSDVSVAAGVLGRGPRPALVGNDEVSERSLHRWCRAARTHSHDFSGAGD